MLLLLWLLEQAQQTWWPQTQVYHLGILDIRSPTPVEDMSPTGTLERTPYLCQGFYSCDKT